MKHIYIIQLNFFLNLRTFPSNKYPEFLRNILKLAIKLLKNFGTCLKMLKMKQLCISSGKKSYLSKNSGIVWRIREWRKSRGMHCWPFTRAPRRNYLHKRSQRKSAAPTVSLAAGWKEHGIICSVVLLIIESKYPRVWPVRILLSIPLQGTVLNVMARF